MKEVKSRDSAIGHKTNMQVTKNKVGIPFKRASFMLMYGQGFEKDYDILTMAETLDVIKKGGAWYSYKDVRGQGFSNFLLEMKNNPLVMQEITNKTFEAINNFNTKKKEIKELDEISEENEEVAMTSEK